MKKNLCIGFLYAIGSLFSTGALAQPFTKVSGRVYDITKTYPLASVSVLSTTGIGTSTDSTGYYTLELPLTDSIWFSYLNKPSARFAVSSLSMPENFDVSIHIPVAVLQPIRIKGKNYLQDSIQNRIDYAKVFGFKRPGINTSSNPTGALGVGIDMEEIIEIFQFKKNRRMLALQQELLKEEEEAFVRHRFTKALIQAVTHFSDEKTSAYIKAYLPTAAFVRNATEYELAVYIQKTSQQFDRGYNSTKKE